MSNEANKDVNKDVSNEANIEVNSEVNNEVNSEVNNVKDMQLGVAYYPEYTPQNRWAYDMTNISRLGISTIRFGEFAWAKLQPAPDKYDFSWMDEAIELAGKSGLKVILATPTACPPVWLVEQHEDVMPVDREGKRAGFGGRQHRCFNSPSYLEYSQRITKELAKRYGQNDTVIGWQIDNELGGEQKTCYCEHCRRKFQERLKEKYKSLDKLNELWMTDFWSQKYSEWSQIPVPSKLNCDMELSHNPGLRFEFAQHCSDSIVEFAKMQYDILRSECKPEMFITTNQDTFTFGDNVNVYKLFKNLDLPAFDIYTNDMNEFEFYCDLFKSCSKTPEKDFAILEFGAETAELAKYAGSAEKRGCTGFSLFTYSSFRNGQERGFQAVFDALDNPTKAVGELEEFQRISAKDKAKAKKKGKSDSNAKDKRKTVYIFYDFRSSWSMEISNPSWRSERYEYHKYLMNNVYRAMREKGYRVEFLFTAAQVYSLITDDDGEARTAKGDTLILADLLVKTAALEEAVTEAANNGINVIATSNLFELNNANGLCEAKSPVCDCPGVLMLPGSSDDYDAKMWEYVINHRNVKRIQKKIKKNNDLNAKIAKYTEKEKKKNAKKVLPHRRFLKTKIFVSILVILATLYSGFVFAMFEPFKSLREMFVGTCLTTSTLRILPEFLFPQSELERIKNIINPVVTEVSDKTKIKKTIEVPEFEGIGEPPSKHRKLAIIPLDDKLTWEIEKIKKQKYNQSSMYISEEITHNGVTVDTKKRFKYEYKAKRYLVQKGMGQFLVDVVQVSNQLFKGRMLVISDPSKVVVSKTRKLNVVGDSLAQLIKNVNGIGGINGGGFVDAGWVGNGGKPIGLLISRGKKYHGYAKGQTVVGFTEKNKLVVGNIGSKAVKKRKLRDAIQFRTPLIINGKTIYKYADNSATGIHPRTAIGQKKTGEVILLSIDGRQAGSPGASLYDVQTILKENGCINACNLDGGHSSFMIWNKKMISNPYQHNPDKTLPDGFVIRP